LGDAAAAGILRLFQKFGRHLDRNFPRRFHGEPLPHGVSWEFHGQTEVALCKLRLCCHFYLSPFGLKVKNFHRPTGCIDITKDIDKMARMGDIASAASD
jgi:hypothetical protein